MQSTSIFDANAFMETTHKGQLDTTYVLPDEGDYLAQTTDKITIRSGTVGEGKQNAGAPWAAVELQWELMDDTLRKKLNQDHVYVRQSFMLDLNEHGQLDLGTNRNMRLKRLLDATGVNKLKSWNFGHLKYQSGYVHVEHSKPDGFDDSVAEITRVTSPDKARANGAG